MQSLEESINKYFISFSIKTIHLQSHCVKCAVIKKLDMLLILLITFLGLLLPCQLSKSITVY